MKGFHRSSEDVNIADNPALPNQAKLKKIFFPIISRILFTTKEKTVINTYNRSLKNE